MKPPIRDHFILIGDIALATVSVLGQPVWVLNLAEDLIRLSALEPYRDIEILYTGIRPGEKLIEELWDEGTSLVHTLHPDIFRLDVDDSFQASATPRTSKPSLNSWTN